MGGRSPQASSCEGARGPPPPRLGLGRPGEVAGGRPRARNTQPATLRGATGGQSCRGFQEAEGRVGKGALQVEEKLVESATGLKAVHRASGLRRKERPTGLRLCGGAGGQLPSQPA